MANGMSREQQAAALAEAQQGLLFLAQMWVECWPTYLDGLEGLVRQGVEPGWTDYQARTLVVAMLGGQQPPQQDDGQGQS